MLTVRYNEGHRDAEVEHAAHHTYSLQQCQLFLTCNLLIILVVQ